MGVRTLPPLRRTGALALAILALALAVRIGYVAATPGYTPSHDDAVYNRLAAHVAHTGAYPDVNQASTAYRPPGYTYVLAGIYAVTGTGPDRITDARVVQAFEGTVIVGLLGLVSLRLFGRRAALCTMAIGAVYVPLVALGASLLSEPQTVALELGAVLAVLRWRRDPRTRWIIAAGLLCGALALTRSNGFVVVIALAFGLWVGRPPLTWAAVRPVAVMLLTTGLVLAPWTIRNAVVMHAFIPVSDEAGATLAGTYNPASAHDRQQPGYWHLLAQNPTYEQAVRPLAHGPEAKFQDRLLHLAIQYAEQHPLYVGKVAVYNTIRLVELDGIANDRYTASLAGISSPGVADGTIFSFWIVATMAVGAALMPGVRRKVPPFVWLAGGLLFLSIVLVNPEPPRLRLPLDPYVILLAGAGAAVVLDTAAQRFAAVKDRLVEPV